MSIGTSALPASSASPAGPARATRPSTISTVPAAVRCSGFALGAFPVSATRPMAGSSAPISFRPAGNGSTPSARNSACNPGMAMISAGWWAPTISIRRSRLRRAASGSIAPASPPMNASFPSARSARHRQPASVPMNSRPTPSPSMIRRAAKCSLAIRLPTPRRNRSSGRSATNSARSASMPRGATISM